MLAYFTCTEHIENTRIVLAYFTRREPIEKYANCVGVFHLHRTHKEIRELCWRISFIWNNMQMVLAYFTHMKYTEKCENMNVVFSSWSTYGEIGEHIVFHRNSRTIAIQTQNLPFPKSVLISIRTQLSYFSPIWRAEKYVNISYLDYLRI